MLIRNKNSSGAVVGVGAAVCVLVLLAAVYVFASNDPQRNTVTPTVDRAPSSTGIGPGRPVTPQEATKP